MDPHHTTATGAILDSSNRLSHGSLKLPPLKPTDVLVEVYGGPINPSDVYYTEGLYPVRRNKPTICGFEGSGVVVQTGGDQRFSWLKGQKVCFFGGDERSFGSWGDFTVMPGHTVFPLPEGINLKQGSCCLVNPLTVEIFLKVCEDKKHKCIVHTGAAGALGKMLIKGCAENGIKLINIVRSEEQVDMLKKSGSQYVLNSQTKSFANDFASLVKELRPSGFFDAVAGQVGSLIVTLMTSNSSVYVYGNLSREDYKMNPTPILFKNIKIEGIWLTKWAAKQEIAGLAAQAFSRLADGTYLTTFAQEFPPSKIKEAIEYYSKNASKGKVLIKNPNFTEEKL